MSIINHPGPEISDAQASEIAERHFGLKGPVARLASERDQNFHFGGQGQGAVLKIVNAGEPDEAIRFQVAMIRHIKAADPGLAVPLVRLSKSGEELPVIEDGKGGRHLIRASSRRTLRISRSLSSGVIMAVLPVKRADKQGEVTVELRQ